MIGIINEHIQALLEEKPFIRVAIDGNCASGKSTLGAALARRWDAALFHMDDFYIPWTMKTPERLAEPGGNVDHERFLREVLQPAPGEVIRWRPFSCQEQRLLDEVVTAPRPVTIIEGSYSMHPKLRSYYDLSIFLSIDPAQQKSRLLRREGADGLRAFENMWIPLENAYFTAFDIRSHCQLTFDVTDSITRPAASAAPAASPGPR